MKFTTLAMSAILASTTMVHASESIPSKGKILMIASNPAQSTVTGWPVGFWAAELTHPWWEFKEAGYDVVLASPQGGKIVPDSYSDPRDASGYSADDLLSLGFLTSPKTASLLEATLSLSQIKLEEYRAVFFVGGQGPMVNWRENQNLQNFLTQAYSTKKPIAVVCHATALLLDAKDSKGKLIVEGKKWTGFSNAEEEYAEKAVGGKLQPFWIQKEAAKIKSTQFMVAAPFQPYAIADGNLITGQQQKSGAAAARLVINQLEKQP